MVKKIISGGQTGVDRAALDVAIELGIEHGGSIPRGRRTENGGLPPGYELEELPSSSYPKRTEKNILDADGTLIISQGKLTGGSALTRHLGSRDGKPWLHIDLLRVHPSEAVNIVRKWIEKHRVEVLNVAGPSASKAPRIYDDTFSILKAVIKGYVLYSPIEVAPRFITEPACVPISLGV